MKSLSLVAALVLLGACAADQRGGTATFTCPNGPDLTVLYSNEGALLIFPDGRREVLAPTETEDLYAKPGVVWDVRVFRSARLTDGETSLSCDQMAG